MTTRYSEIVRLASQPLQPVPSGVQPKLVRLANIQAVVFDIYGTLLISGSGDVGTSNPSARSKALVAALEALQIEFTADRKLASEVFMHVIASHHNVARQQGIEYPEVDITQVWSDTLTELHRRGWIDRRGDNVDLKCLAIEYEVRTNPVWTMPGLERCLDLISAESRRLGIISNAQFFTLEIFPALLNKSITGLGFHDHNIHLSYKYNRAKPGTHLYQMAREALKGLAIKADQVLYIGNDMLNDVLPAHTVGFRTALFAGDARSLRMRETDTRVKGLAPDLVVTHLMQIPECIGIEHGR